MEDWKDRLAALRGEVEEAPEENVSVEASAEEDAFSQKSPLMVVKDKKGRKGKVATIIEGFTIPQDKVEEIARTLKQKLGVGGSVREGEILIQGDYSDKIKQFLKTLSFKVK